MAAPADYSGLKYNELQHECKSQGLSAKGKKEELLERLQQAQRDATAAKADASNSKSARPAASAPAPKAAASKVTSTNSAPAAKVEAADAEPKRPAARSRKGEAPTKLVGDATAKVVSTAKGAAAAGAAKGQEALDVVKAHLLPLPEEASKKARAVKDQVAAAGRAAADQTADAAQGAADTAAAAGRSAASKAKAANRVVRERMEVTNVLPWSLFFTIAFLGLLCGLAAMAFVHPQGPAIRSHVTSISRAMLHEGQARSHLVAAKSQLAFQQARTAVNKRSAASWDYLAHKTAGARSGAGSALSAVGAAFKEAFPRGQAWQGPASPAAVDPGRGAGGAAAA